MRTGILSVSAALTALKDTEAMPAKLSVKNSNDRRTSRRDNGTARPKMTADEATKFSATSDKSESQVIEAINARREEGKHVDCACEPYAEVFTFNRWRAQGLSVKRGETALRVASYVPVGDAKAGDSAGEGDEGAGRTRLIPKTLMLFCRCQVA